MKDKALYKKIARLLRVAAQILELIRSFFDDDDE